VSAAPVDTRRLQRALFRMQLDAGFAARLRRGEPEAARSTGLGARELGWLRALDPDAVAADAGGKRRGQLLRNVAAELSLTIVASGAAAEHGWPAEFPRSGAFHRAVSEDGSLPLAFAAFAAERLRPRAGSFLAGLLALESALVSLRRLVPSAPPPPPPGGLRLAAEARILAVPAGTFAGAAALRAALDAGAPLPPPPASAGGAAESILLLAGPRPRPYGLRPVHVEPLSPLVAAFLEAARDGLEAAAIARFAEDHDVEPGDVEAVATEYIAEGALVRG